jgi:NTP pyrophosphatase (non-canonical NTP hydrolase)
MIGIDFADYQREAATTAVYPRPKQARGDLLYGSYELAAAGKIVPVMYCGLGLAGESGEVVEQIKKSWRNDMHLTPERVGKIADELGDVLWYAAQLATELDLDLQTIAEANLEKLAKRQEEGKLKQHG